MIVGTELDDRIDKCQKILDTDPNSQIFAALAEAYRKKGDLDKAFRICQNGLRVHPSYGSAHVVMAKINLDRGLYDWAEAEIKKAIEIEGNNRAVELLLAEIYIYKGEFNAAVKLLRKLHAADSGNEQIKKLLEIALRIPGEQVAVHAAAQPVRPAIKTADVKLPEVEKSTLKFGPHAILEAAVSIPDMDGAMFLTVDGLVVDSRWQSNLDQQTVGAAMADVSNALTQELVKASFGRVRTLLIETPQGVFYVVRVADGIFLFMGNARVNLGTLRLKVASLIDNYQAEKPR